MILGLLYLFLTFAICFILVHTIKLAYLGFKLSRKKCSPHKEKIEHPPAPEPIYYIVEKKRSKKSTYSEPKEIKFKK